MSTQAIYEKLGTPLVFVNTGGDKLLNLADLHAVTGRMSAFYDRGAGAAPGEYLIRGYCQWALAAAINEYASVAIVESDGTHQDSGMPYHASNDAAITLAEFNALQNFCGLIIMHTDATDTERGFSARVRITSRYFAVAFYNASAAGALTNTNSVSAVVVTPIFGDIQAAA